MNNKKTIAIVGLGYVGLPLAIEFGKYRNVIGFDLNSKRIADLSKKIDRTNEVNEKDFMSSRFLSFSSNLSDIKNAKIFIITVPTPILNDNTPDLEPLELASKMVGSILNKGDIVIYESTVYPGATEEIAVPILEKHSNLKFNIDFYCGYSPERINPGDKSRGVKDITKITSGSNKKVAREIDNLYKEIISAGTYLVSSIMIAEAAKVIENTQRDLNIALINELSMIFNKLNIDTEEVLKASETKWNFIPFRPGIVGGHCIGVDPYYLTFKAIQLGHNPQAILAGRKVNDGMPRFIVNTISNLMVKKNIEIKNSKIIIFGITFKENCPDIRNSKVFNIYEKFIRLGANIDVFDPYANPEEVKEAHGITLIKNIELQKYDCGILAVSHDYIVNLGIKKIKSYLKNNCVLYDIKYLFTKDDSDGRL